MNTFTKTIWISDMSGFTKKTRLNGPRAVMEEIETMRSIATPLLTECGGDVFKIDADNLYATFSLPEEALMASRRVMEALPDSIRICVGIGYGEMVHFPEENDYYGLEVNVASKLGEDIAEADQVLLTESAFKKLPEDIKRTAKGPLSIEVGGHSYNYFSL